MLGIAYVAVMPRWLMDAEEPGMREMLRYICAFDNVDVCKGCKVPADFLLGHSLAPPPV